MWVCSCVKSSCPAPGWQTQGGDDDCQEPQHRATHRTGIEFDDARHHHREEEGQVTDADDDQAQEVTDPGGSLENQPGDKEAHHAIACDVHAEIQDQLTLCKKGDGVSRMNKCRMRDGAATDQHVPQPQGATGHVLAPPLRTDPHMQHTLQCKQPGADFGGQTHVTGRSIGQHHSFLFGSGTKRVLVADRILGS